MDAIDFSVRIYMYAPWAYIRADLPLATDLGAYIRPGLKNVTWAYTRAVTVVSYL